MTETAMRELEELARDVRALAGEIRDRISIAGQDSQDAWIELDREIERFRREVKQDPEESVSELRETGFALKRRLRALQSKITPKRR
jgi:chromosome condensin MukBEF complex kleisin-like MukF subunit